MDRAGKPLVSILSRKHQFMCRRDAAVKLRANSRRMGDTAQAVGARRVKAGRMPLGGGRREAVAGVVGLAGRSYGGALHKSFDDGLQFIFHKRIVDNSIHSNGSNPCS